MLPKDVFHHRMNIRPEVPRRFLAPPHETGERRILDMGETLTVPPRREYSVHKFGAVPLTQVLLLDGNLSFRPATAWDVLAVEETCLANHLAGGGEEAAKIPVAVLIRRLQLLDEAARFLYITVRPTSCRR